MTETLKARGGASARLSAPASGRSLRTRGRLVDAARAVLIENAGAAEIGAIARRAGVSAGLAYHHFGSKDGLVAAVVEEFYARYTRVANARYEGESWAEREIQRTRETVLFLVRDPFAPTLFGPLGRSGAVVETEGACMAELVELGARNIAQGQADGDLPRQVDAKTAAAFVLGGMRQAVTAALLADPDPDPIQLARTVWILIAQSLGLRQGSHS
jgi:AcrR family transcriptional regulator